MTEEQGAAIIDLLTTQATSLEAVTLGVRWLFVAVCACVFFALFASLLAVIRIATATR